MTILLLIAAYFIGGIPFGYLLVRWKTGEDVRAKGLGKGGQFDQQALDRLLGAGLDEDPSESAQPRGDPPRPKAAPAKGRRRGFYATGPSACGPARADNPELEDVVDDDDDNGRLPTTRRIAVLRGPGDHWTPMCLQHQGLRA